MPQVFNGEIYSAVGRYARGAVLFAFEKMGGPEKLAEWGEANPDEFYTKLFPKIIARESEVTHHKTVDQLMDVLDGDYEVDGDFDEAEDLPVVLQSAPNDPDAVLPMTREEWNAATADFEDEDILAAAAVDLVDFEE